MPRPNRAHGRPGTPMVPANFEDDHAFVIRKTHTATCRITAPAGGTPVIGDDLTYPEHTAPTPTYTGGCRVQELSRDEKERRLGDEVQSAVAYLVVVEHSADDIARGHVVEVTGSSDPTLTGDRRLVVARVTRGSVRWERDLYCIDPNTRGARS